MDRNHEFESILLMPEFQFSYFYVRPSFEGFHCIVLVVVVLTASK